MSVEENTLQGKEFSDFIEKKYGLYPDIEDAKFHKKLFRKQEFLENRQESLRAVQETGIDLCDPENAFELSPVQRFVGRFLSAESPYNSALLYHGVGVGKTCAAITIAEGYLRIFPRKKVIIVAPPNIQPNFRRTIFDIDRLEMGDGDMVPNSINGCTSDFYLKHTSTEFEREKTVIATRIRQSIDSRYEFMGYIQFARYIETIRRRYEDKSEARKALRTEFEGRMLIIDEAHNLRDVPGETPEDNLDTPGGDEEVEDSAAGKRLTPSLIELLESVHGMKLCLLTATPMYNNYLEIIFLLNLLLKNDKRQELRPSQVFDGTGNFRKETNGQELLGKAASTYVSFMRGENPLSFPIRLEPGKGIPRMTKWPARSPTGTEVGETKNVLRLPLVPVQYTGDSLRKYYEISDEAVRALGVSVASLDTMTQSGNWLFPADDDMPSLARKGDVGFDGCFEEQSGSQFASRRGAPTWLRAENLGAVSPKAEFLLKNIRTSNGVIFIYSRFVKSGALPLCLALEANGYTPYGRETGFLKDGIQVEGGRQCAYCELREQNHKAATHGKFVPAKYILLTGKGSLSPNNSAMVAAARSNANDRGGVVKAIIGSQVASEGIDLKFVREIYVFDSWFHLNKMEQVLGRGVRTCSHAALNPQERNTTIYLLVNTYPEGEDLETVDLYMYRVAMNKARQVGMITRTLKEYALDCNLNIDAIQIPSEGDSALDDQEHVNAQGQEITVKLHDAPYTAICDWIETCDYKCKNPVDFDETPDTSTYDEYSARWREASLKQAIRKLFEENDQPFFTLEMFQETDKFKAVPSVALRALLADIVGNQSFRVRLKGQEGYIVQKNNYYLFQPDKLRDTSIPLALRVQKFPVKRDIYEPPMEKVVRGEIVGKSIWPTFVGWANLIRKGDSLKDIPTEVLDSLTARYTDPGELTREKQHIFGVLWFYQYMRTDARFRNALADVLLCLVWDEMLLAKEHMELANDVEALRIGAENFRSKGERKVYRYIDVNTGSIKYMCGSSACDIAVAKIFDTDTTDPLYSLQANRKTVGPTYGFLVPDIKRGILVFKTTDKPAELGGIPPKGGVCEKITQISSHFEHLIEIGTMLANLGVASRFGLTKEEFTGPNKFENAIRACSLKNVILRWMDVMKVSGESVKWFFRPIAAYKSNHRVVTEKPKKVRGKKKALIPSA